MKLRSYIRRPAKTAQAIFRWRRVAFNEAPPIFGNAKPKSGSHLLVQILNSYSKIMPYRYLEPDPIRTITKDGRRRGQEEILEDLKRIPSGVIGWGYVDALPATLDFLTERGRVNYFIYRDPRDMLVSQVHYATDMHEAHGLHDYYKSLPDFSERLKVAITGIDKPGLKMASVRERYESVFVWRAQTGVMCVRFEDFINKRDATLNGMLDELEKGSYKIPTPRERCLAILVEAIQPGKSRTFRSGKAGGWRGEFTPEHKKLFKEVAGDLLVRLGYEDNDDW
jgi:sulfotransferase 6B1